MLSFCVSAYCCFSGFVLQREVLLWHKATFLPGAIFGVRRRRQINRESESVVFNSGQKMALRTFYFIWALTKALTYYYINRSQRHLLAAIENNWFGVPIGLPCLAFRGLEWLRMALYVFSLVWCLVDLCGPIIRCVMALYRFFSRSYIQIHCCMMNRKIWGRTHRWAHGKIRLQMRGPMI